MSEARRGPRRLGVAVAIGLGILYASAAHGQTWRTMSSARQVWDRTPMTVELHYGAGTLTVRPGDPPMLYRMQLRYDEENSTPISSFDERTRVLRLGAEGRGRRGGIEVEKGARATIDLTRQVPMSLDVEFGAGDAKLELGGIPLTELEVSTGASETTIRFTEPNPVRAERVQIEAGAADLKVYGLGNTQADRVVFRGGVGATVLDFAGRWSRSSAASVEMGIGSLTLRFPRDLGVRVNRDSFLTSFDAEGMTRRGDSYYSRNWEEATHKLTVDISAALGSIEIDWVD